MKIYTIFFIMLLSVSGMAQQGILSGTVADSKTKELLIGVNVILSESMNKGTVTDADGKYELKLEPGTHNVIYRYVGYTEFTYQVVINSGQTTKLDVAMVASVNELDVFVVSAGRFEQRLEDLTVSMEVIKPYLIENRNNTNISQTLQQVPGVIIIDQEPQIRGGSGYSFGAGSRVQVLLDDIPILSGDIGRASWGYLPTENVEQIEVIKGASSVLYGSSALSGVINLRTAYPRDEPKTKISVFTGLYSAPGSARDNGIYWREDNYKHELGMYHGVQNVVKNPMQGGANFFHSRKKGQLDFVVGANVFTDMGFTGPENPDKIDQNGNAFVYDAIEESGDTIWRKPSQMSENRLRGNVSMRYRSKKIDGLNVGFNSNGMYSESSFALLWLNADSGLYLPRTRAITTTKQVQFNVDPYVEYRNKKGTSQKLKTRYYHLDNDNTNGQSNFSQTYFAEYLLSQDFSKIGFAGLNATLGAMTSYTAAESELYIANERGDGQNEAHNSALFLQLDQKLFEKLTLSGGVRYEWYRINNDMRHAPIFRAGLNYHVLDGTFIRASVGQGIRFPTIGERFIVTAVGGQNIFPNQNLQAERSYNAEFGIKQGFEIGGFKGFIDVAYFYQEYTNFIEFTFGPWGNHTIEFGGIVLPDVLNHADDIFGFMSVNTGKAMVRGIDGSVMGQGKLGSVTVNLLFGYTYVLPQTLDPEDIYAIPALKEVVTPEYYNFGDITYQNTSSYNENNLLKYRVEHQLKLDIEGTYKRYSVGASTRMQTPVRNIDKTFIDLDQGANPILPSGITGWMANNTYPIWVFDMRASFKLSDRSKLAVISSNLFNQQFAMRPLTIEPPRLTMVQYTFEI
jgi:outer membrane receptor protein involved in Fe transport